jgi:metal-dependent HD superfamily phosphatase/phosphodiesterase
MVTYDKVRNSKEILTYIQRADLSLQRMGFTEHSLAHVTKVAVTAGDILLALGYDKRIVELTRIAAFMHDIGNLVNRADHAQSGAIMAFRLLDKMGMPADEVAKVVSTIGNHDEDTAWPVNEVAAALILADKSDVRRSRVRKQPVEQFDIHDRVNYSVTAADLDVTTEAVTLAITIETELCNVLEYFEIFMDRMLLCHKAAAQLGVDFHLVVNGQQMM